MIISADLTVSHRIKENVLRNEIEDQNKVLVCPPVFKFEKAQNANSVRVPYISL